MNRTANLVAEHAVHKLVLLDPAEPREAIGNDLRAEVVASARKVVDVYLGAGEGILDALLELRCLGHLIHDSAGPLGRYIS